MGSEAKVGGPDAGVGDLRRTALPANPNCVCFSADAASVLYGRTWSDAVRAISGPARAFREASGLDVLAGYAWRVQLDRKNHRSVHGLLWFVFDGPATSAHIDLLEAEVKGLVPTVSNAHVERCPVNGAPAVLVDAQGVHVSWTEGTHGPELTTLTWHKGRLFPRVVRRGQHTEGDVPSELSEVLGVPAPYGPEEEHQEQLRLAFAMSFCERVIQADGVVHEDEVEFVQSVFPPDLVRRLGLADEAVRADFLAEALRQLPAQLGHHDKLGLVGLLFSACYSDGTLDAREMRVLKEAGESLGLTREQVVKYLRRFW
ncbi:MAG: TerB family tellurite resistance protein [Alphaproteobacteria bacterium]|nr:TerB family tellurite resistance protein [Alphaproteobacteria bacterium]MCB9698460.1 TerB family tellurite resistance protein [Alphaproteobacteria bacterium]